MTTVPFSFNAALVASLIACLGLSSCASTKATRGPAAFDGKTVLNRKGDKCELNLDGDKHTDRVELSELQGKRVAVITQPTTNGPTRFFVEELSPGQNITCIVNNEPGTPFQGTDESQKAVFVTLSADYIRIGKPSSEARFVFFDVSQAKYRTIYRGD